jgi:putative ABC transport system permease protein
MALTAVGTLALGIGANTALFTVVNAVLLRPMNYLQPDAIVEVTRSWPGFVNVSAVTPTKFDFWRSENHSFRAVAAYNFLPLGVNLTGRGEPERLTSLPVTADFFRVLGVNPLMGRTFSEAEDKPGAGHFVVLSYATWERLLHGDRNAVGQSLTLSGANYVIIGVMPERFDFPEQAELWTPLQLSIDPNDRANDYNVIARLKQGTSLEQATADMHIVAQRLRKRFGDLQMNGGPRETVGVFRYHDWIVGDVRPALLILMGAVGFVLLLACANVANLLLARSTARQHEMGVRTALGASRWRLLEQMLAESLSLSLAGGLLGVLLAQFGLPLLLRLTPTGLRLAPGTEMDWRVFLFSAAVAVATGVLFGLFPAFQSVRMGIGNPLREGSLRTTASAASNRARQILVVFEVAISLVLLVGAGLLVETFKKLSSVEPGFNPHNIVTMQMSLTDDRFRKTETATNFCNRLLTRLEALPGVLSVGITDALPLEPGRDLPFEIIGRHSISGEDMPEEQIRGISPHYFSAMSIPVVAGRPFTERDTRQSSGVAIINEALARKYFPKQNPIGQSILIGRVMGPIFADVPRQIVGVVGDTSEKGLGNPPPPMLFEPFAQVTDALNELEMRIIPLHWVIRTPHDPLRMAEQIRREALTVSGGVPMASPRPLEEVVNSSIAQQRFTMTLLAIFAGLALVLGAMGLYGVISYSVVQRTRELGVRSALGAGRGDLFKLIVGQGMKLAAIGLLIGVAASLGLTRFLQSMLYGVRPSDPFVLASVILILAVIALLACYIPARRAARVDPVIALREE